MSEKLPVADSIKELEKSIGNNNRNESLSEYCLLMNFYYHIFANNYFIILPMI